MGQAKKRAAEIAELKKTTKEKPRRKLILWQERNETVAHFKSEADARGFDFHNSGELTAAVRAGDVEERLVQAATIKVKSHRYHELPPRQLKEAKPLVLVVGRKLSDEEFLDHAMALSQINPQGFRHPSAKAKNYKSTSLMEKISIRMGEMVPRVAPERSDRGRKKHEANQETKAIIILDRLIESNPSKPAKWYFAKTMAALDGDINHEWLENIASEKAKTGGIDPKYLNRGARERIRDQNFEELREAA